MDIGRNDPCPCGSGKKYKKCCLEKDEGKNRKEREKAALNAAKVAAAEAAETEKKEGAAPAQKHPERQQGFFKKVAGRMGFARGQQRRAPPPQNKSGGGG